MQFDGLDDYVALPDNNLVWLPINDFSVCFWVYFERDATYSTYYDNEVLVDLNHASSSNPDNELGYLILGRGDTAQEIYIDGELDAWRTCTSTPIDFIGGYDDDKVNVGRYTNTADWPRYYFKGMMDELALFDRALSSTEVRQLYRDDAPRNWHVDGTHGSDKDDGLSSQQAFATIQKAIQSAKNGDVINVHPGVYREAIRCLGKAISVRSTADAAIIEAPGRTAVSFDMGEGPESVLRNVIIRNSRVGISCTHSTPTIANVNITGNVDAVQTAWGDPYTSISNSILWGNYDNSVRKAEYCCVQIDYRDGFSPDGIGNFSAGPLFVDAADGDGVFDNTDYELFMILWEQRRQSEPLIAPRRR